MQEISEAIDRIADDIASLRELLTEPEKINFSEVVDSFVKLEQAFSFKGYSDAFVAYCAHINNAGTLVGSKKSVDFLVNGLDLSLSEARDRLARGINLFSSPPVAAEECNNLRENTAKTKVEKLKIIDRELRSLKENTEIGTHRLRAEFISKAQDMGAEALGQYMRNRVKEINCKSDPDPYAALKRRKLTVSKPDKDGGVYVSGYLPPATGALLKSLLTPARRKGAASPVAPEKDKRTWAQRRVDVFHQCLAQNSSMIAKQHGGVGTVIVSATMEELEKANFSTRFYTNTDVELSPLDLLMLGLRDDLFACLMNKQGIPLQLGRSKRTASVYQRLALVAREAVCSHPHCEQPASNCDVHHLVAWFEGGRTDLENLTLLCRHHHTSNNDRRDFRFGVGHYGREAGVVKFYRPGAPPEENESPARRKSAGYRIRLADTPTRQSA